MAPGRRDPRGRASGRGAHRRPAPARHGGAGTGGTQPRPAAPKRPAAAPPSPPDPSLTRPFRLGAIEGATPGKWIDIWQERMPDAPLVLVPLDLPGQRAAVRGGDVDAALVRLPLVDAGDADDAVGARTDDRAGLHVIALYDELPVVVCAVDSHLTAADELTLDDLAGEVVITPRHPPLRVDVPGAVAPRFAAPATVADAIATVATGVGLVIVPMSLARLHARKDVAHRPLAGAPTSPVALVWREGETTPAIDAFIGIVRGRTAHSSR